MVCFRLSFFWTFSFFVGLTYKFKIITSYAINISCFINKVQIILGNYEMTTDASSNVSFHWYLFHIGMKLLQLVNCLLRIPAK